MQEIANKKIDILNLAEKLSVKEKVRNANQRQIENQWRFNLFSLILKEIDNLHKKLEKLSKEKDKVKYYTYDM